MWGNMYGDTTGLCGNRKEVVKRVGARDGARGGVEDDAA